MSDRSAPLFTPEGKATLRLRGLWVQKGALQPLSGGPLLEEDRSATRLFRGLWQRAFPTRASLPFGPLADDAGRGTDRLWEVLA